VTSPSLRRLEIIFSQGAEWKALISRYIATIPVKGDALAAQSMSGVSLPRTLVSSVMIAKVGEAASASHSAGRIAAEWPPSEWIGPPAHSPETFMSLLPRDKSSITPPI